MIAGPAPRLQACECPSCRLFREDRDSGALDRIEGPYYKHRLIFHNVLVHAAITVPLMEQAAKLTARTCRVEVPDDS